MVINVIFFSNLNYNTTNYVPRTSDFSTLFSLLLLERLRRKSINITVKRNSIMRRINDIEINMATDIFDSI